MTTIPHRPLALIVETAQAAGLDVTHAYEELVFLSHNTAILKMGDEGEDVSLYFNVDMEEQAKDPLYEALVKAGVKRGLCITLGGTYELKQQADQQIAVTFHAAGGCPGCDCGH